MNEKNTDDIFALCSRFDLDQDSYRVFPKRAQKVAPPATQAAIRVPEPEQTERELPEAASEPLQTSMPDASPRLAAEHRAMRADLRNLLRNLGVSGGLERPCNFEELLATGIFVHAAAGGVGATTTVATLARLLARQDKRCVVVDGRPNSLLSFSLGSRPVSLEPNGTPGARAAVASAIRVVTRDHQRAEHSLDEAPDEVWYRRSVMQLKGAVDHILVDAMPHLGNVAEANPNCGVSLIVAIPDANSLAGSLSLKQQLEQEAPNSRVICVLNRYDRSVPLHVDIGHWFEETFQTVKITRSEVVNEALTEGLTVADWAPDSDVARDFAHLLNAVRAASGSPIHRNCEQGSIACQ